MQIDTKAKAEFLQQYKDKFELKKIKIAKKAKEWELCISLKKLVLISELNNIEKQIAEYYNLNKVRIVVEESAVKLDADEMVISHWEDLKKILISNNPSFTGFLMDAKAIAENGNIRLTVASKEAASYLNSKKCNSILSQYLKDYLNIDTQVMICFNEADKQCDEEYLKCYFEEENKIVNEALKPKKEGK
ncbi:MAG: hypothetical protein ACM3ZR_07095, partial [Pseudomonadota bacterium]